MRLLTLSLVFAMVGSAHADSITQVTSFGTNPGSLQMYVHVPASLPSGRPLVVVMHGCTMTASSMESAGWDALADQYKFAVVYPQQTSSNNPVECFNWAGNYGNLADLTRGQGENESIIQMVDTMISTYGSDTHQVYVTGFSAGAAFTAVMLATWPDRFAAGAIMEGLPYKCGTDVSSALQCQSPGTTKTAAAWGDLVRAADSTFTGPYPRVQIWEGTSDTTVVPGNATELIKQWTNVWGTDQTADATETVGGATHTMYKAGTTVVVDVYSVSGMDHAVALGTDTLGTCPGVSGAQYFENKNVCSTLRAAQFFGLLGSTTTGTGTDTTPPQLAFETPSDGATVTGAVTIVIAASDNVGVTDVDLAVDGVAIGSVTMAPFQIVWDASTVVDGMHTLTAVGRDAAGNTATATASITVADNVGGTGSGSGSGSDGDGAGPSNDLPACTVGAAASPRALWPIAAAFATLLLRRRRSS